MDIIPVEENRLWIFDLNGVLVNSRPNDHLPYPNEIHKLKPLFDPSRFHKKWNIVLYDYDHFTTIWLRTHFSNKINNVYCNFEKMDFALFTLNVLLKKALEKEIVTFVTGCKYLAKYLKEGLGGTPITILEFEEYLAMGKERIQ